MSGIKRWKGKTALVTGASGGIGLATAKALALEGLRVVISARDGERLEELKVNIEKEGGEALAVAADLGLEDEIHELFAKIRQSWGGVDILINNAGLGLQGDLSGQSPEDWREMLDINVLALSICTQEALKDMEGQGEAHIINISSIAAHRVPPGASPFYSASKHAVRALTEGLRMELAKRGSPIRLGMISPGLVETGFHDRATKGQGDSRAFYSRFKPLTAEDIAEVVCFLLSTPPHVNIHDVIIRSTEQPF